MVYLSENGNIIYFLKGCLRVDNAENVKNEIMSIIASHPDEKIIIDATDLHFISSAGLRVLLAVQKMKELEKVVVRNVATSDINMATRAAPAPRLRSRWKSLRPIPLSTTSA